jgi:crotonobetainyl-CoA:carnitine CoA-transferase CaiB-like acyl-CoA transferase
MGPFASQILGDYGADVVKVEPPQGDPVRGDIAALAKSGLTRLDA